MQILPAIRCHEFPVRLKTFVDFVSSQIVFMVDLEQYQSFLFIGIKFELGRLDFNSCQHPFPKDSHIGAFAAIMLALYYMIDIAAISEIHTQKAVSALAAVFFLARCFSGIAVMTLQPAKKEGLLYTFASSAQKVRVKAALYFQAALCVVLMLLVSGWYGTAAIGAALISFFYFKKKSYKELGGITGDTAGFFVTVCEAAAAAAVVVAGYFL